LNQLEELHAFYGALNDTRARTDSASHYPWVIAMRVERQISGLQQLCET